MSNLPLSLAQIQSEYPDQWVLLGNPVLRNPEIEASIISQLVSGVVLCHAKDRNDIVPQARQAKKDYTSTTLIHTGKAPQGKKFWL